MCRHKYKNKYKPRCKNKLKIELNAVVKTRPACRVYVKTREVENS